MKIFLVALCLASIPCLAETRNKSSGGNSVDNGGDLVALRFTRIGKNILIALKNDDNQKILSQKEIRRLEDALEDTKVSTVSGPIYDNRGKQVDARYLHAEEVSMIELDRERWEKILKDQGEVYRLVLHEYLRAAGVDDDLYKVSSQLNRVSAGVFATGDKTFSGKHIVDLEDSYYVLRDSSEANREGKKYSVMAGFAIEDGAAIVGDLGYYLRPDMIAEISLTRGVIGVEGYSNNYTIGLKKFVGNSFYFKPAVNYRHLTLRGNLVSAVLGINTEPEIYSHIGPQISIGNQWQWDNFTLAVDWIGVYYPSFQIMGKNDSQSRSADWKFLKFTMGVSF